VRRAPQNADETGWDPAAGTLDPADLAGVDGVVHLAGAGIGDRRWSPARRREIVTSRVRSTEVLARALAAMASPPTVLVNASAVGIYGDRGDEQLTEASALGTGFLAELCRAWEAATEPASAAGVRVVRLRSGVVLAAHGGALARQLPLFRLGVGGRLGSGRQWMSWITLRDESAAILRALDDAALEGPVNAAAPVPVTNRDFTRALGSALHRPVVAAVPRAALTIALGAGVAKEVVLASQRVLPAKLEEIGFSFRDPEIDGALGWVLAR
jgi:uncharacterized protein (TIGR01777 family)